MRQHLSLSEYAYNVINTDMIGYFQADTLASFISLILRNYYNSPDVSFFSTYEQDRSDIRSSFERFDSDFEESVPSDYDEYFIFKICLGNLEKKLKAEKHYPNDVVLKPYIQNDIAYLLDEQMQTEEAMFEEGSDFAFLGRPQCLKSRAAYIKNILETYARQTPFKRETIMYKDIIDEAKKIEQFYKPEFESSELKLNMYRIELRKINSFGKIEIEECLAKPYRVTMEHETIHPYFLAYTYMYDPITKTRKPEIDYFPCASIIKLTECPPSHGSGKLTKEQKDSLENTVSEYGFYGMDAKEVTVSFSQQGIADYLSAPAPKPYSNPVHMRSASNHRKIMIFKGDPKQIMRYFSSYGDYAMILSPAECNDTMKELYSDSDKTYTEYTLAENKSAFTKSLIEELQKDITDLKNYSSDWISIHDKYFKMNHEPANTGIYPLFIKTAAKHNVRDAYPVYADLLFEGLQIPKDYNLAGEYYGASDFEKLDLEQKYNMISIYKNGLCRNHPEKEGRRLLASRNMSVEKYFEYKSPEGYTFYAPEIKYQDLFNISGYDD